MSRIFIAGLCPLPFENTPRNYGPGIRSWQFARGLAERGHDVRLIAMTIDGAYDGEPPSSGSRSGVEIRRVDHATLMDPRWMRREIQAFAPDALIGATIYGSYAIAQTGPELPFWADQFGHVMAEAQAKAALEQNNWPIPHFWPMAQTVGQHCDRLSTVSERQRYAAIGELGALGRLTAETSGYDFTVSIPCALAPERVASETPTDSPVLKGPLVPVDAFVVLWSGGYNVWSDVDTVFRAVETAMGRHAEVHFVSTGGGIDGHDLDTYSRFEAMVASSPHQDRYHLLGWVDGDLVPRIVAESDLGVLAERPIYEGLLGSKNRVIEWMASGLLVAYNQHGDLGDLLSDEELGVTFPVGSHAELASALCRIAEAPETFEATVSRARKYAESKFTFEITTQDLCNWAQNPHRAPDRLDRVRAGTVVPTLRDGLKNAAESSELAKSRLARRLWRHAYRAKRALGGG